jgi:voltage-gated potassium channel
MLNSLNRLIRLARRRKDIGIGLLMVVLVASVVGNALTFFLFDRGDQPDLTIADAFWYSVVSITTIGYGDLSAASLGARLGTIIFIIVLGLAAFTSALGMGVDWILDLQFKERSGMGNVGVKNHLLIINFPDERRVRQIIEEFLHDSRHLNDEIVVVTDRIEISPFTQHNVYFVRGSPLEEEVYHRANVGQARQAIVLSTGYDDPSSDSLVASIVSILEHLNPDLRSVAECLNTNHSLLFEGAKNVSLVYTFRMSTNLIVQEAQDPGVNILTQAITSNQIDGTLVSTNVEAGEGLTMPYREVAKRLLDHDVNLVGVIRGSSVHVQFDTLAVEEADRLVYISSARYDWQRIRSLLG